MDTVTDLNDGQVDEKMDNAIYGFAYDEDSPSQALVEESSGVYCGATTCVAGRGEAFERERGTAGPGSGLDPGYSSLLGSAANDGQCVCGGRRRKGYWAGNRDDEEEEDDDGDRQSLVRAFTWLT